MPLAGRRLFVISNYLPHLLKKKGNNYGFLPHLDSLVTVLEPMVSACSGDWLGRPGCPEDAPIISHIKKKNLTLKYNLKPVIINNNEDNLFTDGYISNFIKPVFHNKTPRTAFEQKLWDNYLYVNEQFANEIINNIRGDQFIWVHGCELMMVGQFLKDNDFNSHLNFFLDTPFPPLEMFKQLPTAYEIINGLLAYEHVGFQTPTDKNNFAACLKYYIPDVKIEIYNQQSEIKLNNRLIKVGIYPIEINFYNFNDSSEDDKVQKEIQNIKNTYNNQKIILGLDNINDIHSIKNRLLTIECLIKKYPELAAHISLLQIIKPEHMTTKEHQKIKRELENIAYKINEKFGQNKWVPINLKFVKLSRTKLLAYYNASDIALFTPLKKGMCLSAKEFCASRINNDGILILSEFTGAAQILKESAFIVNPHDIESTADAVYASLLLEDEEISFRMGNLREEIHNYNSNDWLEWFLESEIIGKDEAVPIAEFV